MKIEELAKFNEWWETGRVDEKNLEKYRRYLFHKILKFVEDRQIILITGLRRVGKTSLLYQIIDALLEKGTDKKNIFYFSFDEKEFDFKDVLETYKMEVLRRNFKEVDKIYLFLDEIQKIDDWENKVKVFYDVYPNVKFFLSGSASLILSKKAKESLAGRMYEFVLKPFTFREFLEMKGVKFGFDDAKLLGEKIALHFADFLIKGGFPEITEESDEEKIRSYVKLSVIDRIIYQDVPGQFGKTDIALLENLTGLFLKNPGFVLNFDNLAKTMRRDRKTLMSYIHYLRFSLLINFVSNFRVSVLATSRKNRKVYPAASSLVFASYGNFDSGVLGGVLETVFCSETDAKYYFREGKNEIDFLIMKDNKIAFPVEIRSKIHREEIIAYAFILNKLGLNKGLVLTMNSGFDEFYENGIKILVFPLWAFLLFAEDILKKFE